MNSSQETPDWAALVARVLAGDRNKVEELGEALGLLGRKYCYRSGLSREDAEDLAQDFAVRAISRLRQFDGRNFIGWAFGILRNLLCDHCRQRNRQVPTVPLLDSDCEDASADPGRNGSLTKSEQSALEEALSQLKPDERTLIESQTGSQKVSFEQIGQELGISKGGARVRHHRAKEKLEIFLRKDSRMKAWLSRHHSK